MATSPRRPVQSPTARNVLRIVGAVFVLAGLFLAIRGGMAFGDSMSSDLGDDSGGFGAIFQLAGGGFMIVFGLAALSAGFLGAQADYAAGETSGAVREFGSAFRGEPEGRGDGSSDARPGRFCPECGNKNDAEARFCDSCGHAVAPS